MSKCCGGYILVRGGDTVMDIPHETHNKQKVGNRWITNISVKWIVSLLCLLIIFLVGIVRISANYHQRLSEGSVPVTAMEPIPHSASGQAQDIEKMARSTDRLATKPSIWPTSGEVTSGFGWRNSPWGDGSEFHPGIDIANSMGTPIVATADGEVVKSEASGGYGNIVQIDHGNGITTIYGHNSRIIVNVGQSVKKGQVISYLGSTGRSTGPHVHYEVRVNGTAVDPTSFMVQ
jgi:murein DD-endopeptidase MepM/ murein hydrolase activator NlpD